ncbi:sugar ABC transporter ATP-binding protein [Thermopolyspora sp. NPDC052614]|uniref:sugar ABC transporter ATP-binding protein n=1 Tax=Thermopolyspora sp. NPDC052614 TaxID=3155682 RepID=UPI0034431317
MPAFTHTDAAALELRRVTKSFNGRVVLDLDGLEIHRGEIHALLGQNGSGKSTLIKILSGYHEADPDPGMRIRVSGAELTPTAHDRTRDPGLRFVHQDLGLIPSMSVLDNIYLGGRPYPTRGFTVRTRLARGNVREALARVGLTSLKPDTPVADLSPAERTRVAIARALATDGGTPSVLVLDEPTATLPARETDRLLATLTDVAETGVAILYVTHHLDEVFRIATNVTILRDGRMVASGPTSEFTRPAIVHHLVGTELEAVHRSAPVAHPENPSKPAEPRLVVEELVGDFIDGMSFSVAPGEVVGFYGVTGSGRDSVLGSIFGARVRRGGVVRVTGEELPPLRPDLAIQRGLGFVPADRKALGCFLGLSARENVTMPALKSFWRRGRIDLAAEECEANTWLDRLGVRPADASHLPLTTFSGGNQQKIVLAKWLRTHPLVLLLDEPTQGVDIGAKAAIHRAILKAVAEGLAVVIASSDDEEMAALCSRVHLVQRGRIVSTLVGAEISEAELGRRLNDPVRGQPRTPEGTSS